MLHIAIMAVLTTYSYQWNSEVRLQDKGAPIGHELAGALARVTCSGGTSTSSNSSTTSVWRLSKVAHEQRRLRPLARLAILSTSTWP